MTELKTVKNDASVDAFLDSSPRKQSLTLYIMSGFDQYDEGCALCDLSLTKDWILSAPSESILSVTSVSVPEPEPARIRKSIPCAFCGEAAMKSRIRYINGKPACIPCNESKEMPHPPTNGTYA